MRFVTEHGWVHEEPLVDTGSLEFTIIAVAGVWVILAAIKHWRRQR